MATITATPTSLGTRECMWTWTSMGNADNGEAVSLPWYDYRSIQVIATNYGSATLVIQGSLDGTNWVTLADPNGNALSFTSGAKLEAVLENTRYVRPSTSGGTGTDLTVILYALRRND